MTLTQFQKLLNKIDPRLRIRHKKVGDVNGLFVGISGKGGYICRLTKGEFHATGFRMVYTDEEGNQTSRIKKRGRKTVINLLRNYRWLTNHKQRTMLLHGIEYPDEEVRGTTVMGGGSNV